MKLDIEFTPAALEDEEEIFAYLADNNLETALRFYDNLAASLEMLRTHPFIGATRASLIEGLRDVRMWLVSGFYKYLILYRPLPDKILVIRILHSARDIQNIVNE